MPVVTRSRAKAAAAGSSQRDALDLLPSEAWNVVALQLRTVEDLWALTASSKSLLALRHSPELKAWRELRVKAVKAVHQCNVWIRALRCNNVVPCWEKLLEEYHMPAPSPAFVEFLYPYACASTHRAIIARPRLAAVLGPDRCAALVTPEDHQAERNLEREVHPELWEGVWKGAGPLSSTSDNSWVCWAVDSLEQVVQMVQEEGLNLDLKVPMALHPWASHEFKNADQDDVQPMWEWFEDCEPEFGALFVAAMMERFGQ